MKLTKHKELFGSMHGLHSSNNKCKHTGQQEHAQVWVDAQGVLVMSSVRAHGLSNEPLSSLTSWRVWL